MELQQWEIEELEKLRQKREEDLPVLYFQKTDKNERRQILDRIKEKEGETEFVLICEELFENRYVPKNKNVQEIDHAIRGWLNIRFLPETAKGFFSKKKLPEKVQEILDDLGYSVCEKYGSIGRELWFKELCNTARVYVALCQRDKAYGSVILGLGKVKPERLMNKIGEDMVNTTYTIPKQIGKLIEFEQLAQAAKTVFVETYPKNAMLYENLLDQSDMGK